MVITKYNWRLSVNQVIETPDENQPYKAECIAQRTSTEGLAIITLFISFKKMFIKNMEAEFWKFEADIFWK